MKTIRNSGPRNVVIGGMAAVLLAAGLSGQSGSASPDPAAVVLRLDKTIRWSPAGGQREEIFSRVKILSEEGVRQYGIYRSPYLRAVQEIQVELAGTVLPDGTPVPLKPEAVRDEEALPSGAARFYPDYRVKVISFPQVVPGSRVEARVVRKTSGRQEGIGGEEFFQTFEPLMEKRLQIVVPEGTPFRWRLFQGERVETLHTVQNFQDVYGFYTQEMPPLRDEPGAPGPPVLAARLVWSIFENWEAAARDFTGAFFQKARQNSLAGQQAQILLRTGAGFDGQLEALHAFITRKIQLLPGPAGFSATSLRTPDQVLESGQGGAADRGLLLAAFCQAAGWQWDAVLVNSEGAPVAEEVPVLAQFDRLLIRVARPEGGHIYLDPAATRGPAGYCPFIHRQTGLICGEQSCHLEQLAPGAAGESTSLTNIAIQLDERGGARIVMDAAWSGWFALTFAEVCQGRTAGAMAPVIEEMVRHSLPSARILRQRLTGDADPSVRAGLELELEVPACAVEQDGAVILDLSVILPVLLLEAWLPEGMAGRQYPWKSIPLCRSRVQYTITGPPGSRLLYSPPPAAGDEPEWKGRIAGSISGEGNVLVLVRELETGQSLISPASWERHQLFRSRLGRPEMNLLLFGRRP